MKIHVSKVVQVIADDISDQSDQTLCLKSPKKVSELLHCSIFEVLHPKKTLPRPKISFSFLVHKQQEAYFHVQQMKLLGIFSYHLMSRLGFELMPVELHRGPGPLQGNSYQLSYRSAAEIKDCI